MFSILCKGDVAEFIHDREFLMFHNCSRWQAQDRQVVQLRMLLELALRIDTGKNDKQHVASWLRFFSGIDEYSDGNDDIASWKNIDNFMACIESFSNAENDFDTMLCDWLEKRSLRFNRTVKLTEEEKLIDDERVNKKIKFTNLNFSMNII